MSSYLPLPTTTPRRAHAPLKLVIGAGLSVVLCVLSLPSIAKLYSTHTLSPFPSQSSCVDSKCPPTNPILPTPAPPPPDTTAFTDKERLSLEDIRLLTASTNGFLARDWDLGLGWNNMRYIIETALHQAKLLHRTLVLPSFVYARACQYDINVCADYVPMVNRGDAVGNDEWRDLPIEQQMGWRLPIDIMLNVTHLRESQPVITTADYLLLHGQDPATEASNGYWRREEYMATRNIFTGQRPSFFVVENDRYEPKGTVRVNEIPSEWQDRARNTSSFDQSIDAKLREALGDDRARLEWDKVREALNVGDNDEEVMRTLRKGGWEVLHTYASVVGMDFNKAVVEPIKQAAPLASLIGFKNDLDSRKEDVVFLAGGLHYQKKPGSMLFTSRESQDVFSNIVLYDMQRRSEFMALAERLVSHMYEITDGRQWMAAHMRRGDFVRTGWVMESTPEKHIERVKRHLREGREVVLALKDDQDLETFDIPRIREPDTDVVTRAPPKENERFFVATDEQDPDILDFFRDQGAVFTDDLLTIADRREFGVESGISWAMMITDVRALVEQVVLSRGAFFYGHAMSSVAGGVMNLRAVQGTDPRTLLID